MDVHVYYNVGVAVGLNMLIALELSMYNYSVHCTGLTNAG